MAKNNVLLDSDVIIWWLRGNSDITKEIHDLHVSGKLFTTPVNVAEIYAGIRLGETAIIEKAFSLTTVLDIDFQIALKAGEYLKKFQKSHGVQLGDALIGAASEVYELKLWTLNKKHYPMLKQLAFY